MMEKFLAQYKFLEGINGLPDTPPVLQGQLINIWNAYNLMVAGGIGSLDRKKNRKKELDDCRSTPARHAASPYQPKRHPNAQGETQTIILLSRLFANYTLTILIHCAYIRIRI